MPREERVPGLVIPRDAPRDQGRVIELGSRRPRHHPLLRLPGQGGSIQSREQSSPTSPQSHEEHEAMTEILISSLYYSRSTSCIGEKISWGCSAKLFQGGHRV